ncbi:hypothetical protein JCM8547_001406 [Rhodosporidiobolus lusitaniae]
MGAQTYGDLAIFYGVPVLLRSLVRALIAWVDCRGALFEIDRYLAEPQETAEPTSTSPAIERVPAEIWLLIKGEGEGNPPYLGELWKDFKLPTKRDEEGAGADKDKQEDLFRCRTCKEPLNLEETVYRNWEETYGNLNRACQQFLDEYDLTCPTEKVFGREYEGWGSNNRHFVSFLAAQPFLGHKPQIMEGSGQIINLNPAVPDGTDERILSFIKEWRLETSECGEEGTYSPVVDRRTMTRIDREEAAEKERVRKLPWPEQGLAEEKRQQAVRPKPQWRAYAMVSMWE